MNNEIKIENKLIPVPEKSEVSTFKDTGIPYCGMCWDSEENKTDWVINGIPGDQFLLHGACFNVLNEGTLGIGLSLKELYEWFDVPLYIRKGDE